MVKRGRYYSHRPAGNPKGPKTGLGSSPPPVRCVLLRAQTLFEPDALFLGWWTVEVDGSGPRLFAEEEARPAP